MSPKGTSRALVAELDRCALHYASRVVRRQRSVNTIDLQSPLSVLAPPLVSVAYCRPLDSAMAISAAVNAALCDPPTDSHRASRPEAGQGAAVAGRRHGRSRHGRSGRTCPERGDGLLAAAHVDRTRRHGEDEELPHLGLIPGVHAACRTWPPAGCGRRRSRRRARRSAATPGSASGHPPHVSPRAATRAISRPARTSRAPPVGTARPGADDLRGARHRGESGGLRPVIDTAVRVKARHAGPPRDGAGARYRRESMRRARHGCLLQFSLAPVKRSRIDVMVGCSAAGCRARKGPSRRRVCATTARSGRPSGRLPRRAGAKRRRPAAHGVLAEPGHQLGVRRAGGSCLAVGNQGRGVGGACVAARMFLMNLAPFHCPRRCSAAK